MQQANIRDQWRHLELMEPHWLLLPPLNNMFVSKYLTAVSTKLTIFKMISQPPVSQQRSSLKNERKPQKPTFGRKTGLERPSEEFPKQVRKPFPGSILSSGFLLSKLGPYKQGSLNFGRSHNWSTLRWQSVNKRFINWPWISQKL